MSRDCHRFVDKLGIARASGQNTCLFSDVTYRTADVISARNVASVDKSSCDLTDIEFAYNTADEIVAVDLAFVDDFKRGIVNATARRKRAVVDTDNTADVVLSHDLTDVDNCAFDDLDYAVSFAVADDTSDVVSITLNESVDSLFLVRIGHRHNYPDRQSVVVVDRAVLVRTDKKRARLAVVSDKSADVMA